jgi:hypothetical protein
MVPRTEQLPRCMPIATGLSSGSVATQAKLDDQTEQKK